MTFSDIASKKVMGVPVLYLGLAAVVILAIVAYKMDAKSADPADDTPKGDPDAGGLADDEATDAYAGLASGGTVTVVQAPTNPTATENEYKSNDMWVKDGAEWLAEIGDATGPAASTALTKYVTGVDRSYAEQELVDKVYKKFGAPPEGVIEGGGISNKPAQKQFTSLPGVHTVVNDNDNDIKDLAVLYYNSGIADRQDLIEVANTALGPGPWPTGAKVNIPVYKPIRFYYPKVAESKMAVAAKNSLSRAQLDALNNGPTWTKWGAHVPKGGKVRIL